MPDEGPEPGNYVLDFLTKNTLKTKVIIGGTERTVTILPAIDFSSDLSTRVDISWGLNGATAYLRADYERGRAYAWGTSSSDTGSGPDSGIQERYDRLLDLGARDAIMAMVARSGRVSDYRKILPAYLLPPNELEDCGC